MELLLLNTLFVTIIIFIDYQRKCLKLTVYYFLAYLIPIIGVVIYVFSQLVPINDQAGFKDNNKRYVKPSWLLKEDINEIQAINLSGTIEQTAEDILKFGDKEMKRTFIMHILKANPVQFLDILTEAINNDDSETAHYAAAGFVEIKRKGIAIIKTITGEFVDKLENNELDNKAFELIKNLITGKMIDEKAKEKMLPRYELIVNSFYNSEKVSEEAYLAKINLEMDKGNFVNLEKIINKFITEFPYSEKPYVCYLKYYFNLKDYQKFTTIIDKIIKKKITLSEETKTMIDFWCCID